MLIDWTAPHIIDFTSLFVPVLWGMVGLLLVLAGAIAASADLDTAEVYLGNRALLIATAAVLVVTIAALAIVRGDFAARIGLVTSG